MVFDGIFFWQLFSLDSVEDESDVDFGSALSIRIGDLLWRRFDD
jgi:hypothetical protein